MIFSRFFNLTLFSLGLAAFIVLNASIVVAESTSKCSLDANIHRIIDKEISRLKSDLTGNDVLAAVVAEKNLSRTDWNEKRIQFEDEVWRNSVNSTDFMNEMLVNDAAEVLANFADLNPGYSEIFITDAKGLNVAMTNQTSDFWQADEGWWQKAFYERGGCVHGEVEYDESSESESIAISLPIKNNEGKPIGVIKAVYDILSITINS